MTDEYKYFKNKYIDNINVNYFKPILNDVFEKYGKKFKVMADVGCGNGIFTAYLKEFYDIKLYGFDASKYALECASQNGFDKVFLNKDFSADSLQAEDDYFDFVINKDVLEHLMDPVFLIKEINRILKPEGSFLLHVPNDFNLWTRIKFVFFNNVDTHNYSPDAKEWNKPHIRFFTYRGIKELLQMYDFEIVKNYSSFFAHFPVISRIPGYMAIGKWLANRYPSQFSKAVTLLAKKKSEYDTQS